MRTLRQATAVFCMACIGAELLTALVGTSRTARCIKAAAGVYILAVLFSLLPGTTAAFQGLYSQAAVDVPSVPVQESAEAQILSRTEEQLEAYCTEQCRQKFGTQVQIALMLEKSGQEISVRQATVAFLLPPDAAQE